MCYIVSELYFAGVTCSVTRQSTYHHNVLPACCRRASCMIPSSLQLQSAGPANMLLVDRHQASVTLSCGRDVTSLAPAGIPDGSPLMFSIVVIPDTPRDGDFSWTAFWKLLLRSRWWRARWICHCDDTRDVCLGVGVGRSIFASSRARMFARRPILCTTSLALARGTVLLAYRPM